MLETSLGRIELDVFPAKAPLSAGSFLRFLDAGLYEGGSFYRVVRPDNDNGTPPITVVQGGARSDGEAPATLTAPVAHEPTRQTTLRHTDGAVSLARGEPGSASGAAFFICIGAQPALDFGGQRNPDRQGFAAFGRVTAGMAVVRAINAKTDTRKTDDAYVRNQLLSNPVVIVRAYRKQSD